jgi:integrase
MASIEKRNRAGKTTYRVRYRDPAGHQRSKVFARRLDAERWMVANETAKLQGAWVDPRGGRTRFADLAERWWASTAGLKPSTRDQYRKLLDHHVLPAFASASVGALDRLAVSEWLARLLSDGTSAVRARDAYRVLRLVLAAGVDGGMLAVNPAAGVRLPRVGPVEMLVLNPAEVERLARSIRPPYGVLVNTAAYSGMRAGELAALRVGRLDLLAGRAEVVASITEVAGRLVAGTTKTYQRRTVRLPRFLCEQLGAYLADRPHGPDDLVFTMAAGGPLRQSIVSTRLFKPAVRAAGLDPRLRFHDLRHTCASLLIRQGASVKAVQAQLGHASASVTLDRYGHLFPDELEHLADRLEHARSDAISGGLWPQRGPEVVALPTTAPVSSANAAETRQ